MEKYIISSRNQIGSVADGDDRERSHSKTAFGNLFGAEDTNKDNKKWAMFYFFFLVCARKQCFRSVKQVLCSTASHNVYFIEFNFIKCVLVWACVAAFIRRFQNVNHFLLDAVITKTLSHAVCHLQQLSRLRQISVLILVYVRCVWQKSHRI